MIKIKALLAALLTLTTVSVFAASVVVGGAGSTSGASSNASTGVFGTGASIQATTNQTAGHATVIAVAGTGSPGGVSVGGGTVNTNSGTTSGGLSAGVRFGGGFGFTGGSAGSQAGSGGFAGFFGF